MSVRPPATAPLRHRRSHDAHANLVCHDRRLYLLTPLLRQRNIPANAADCRRQAPTGRHRRAAPGAGRGRAAAGDPRVPRRDRARAAPAAGAGRAAARGRLLPHGDPALAGRPAGRSADLPARRRAAGRGRRLGRLEPRQQQHRPARHARPAGRGRPRDLRARGRHRHRRHRGAGRRPGGAGRGRLPRQRALDLRQRLPGEPLDAGQLPDPRRRRAAPPPGWRLALLARGVPARRGGDRPGQLGRGRAARHRQLRLDGGGRLPAGAADDGPCRRPARQPVGALAGHHLRACRRRPGSGRTTAR